MVKEAFTQAVRLVHPLMWGNCSALNSRLTSPGSSPRAWGNLLIHRSHNSRTGSSPRAWGKRPSIATIIRDTRIIPARVGETKDRHFQPWTRPDHPRARGGNAPLNGPQTQVGGSSPRAWGKRRRRRRRRVGEGIIPARVGETGRTDRPSAWPTDHPRARGGNWRRAGPASARGG